MAFTAQAEVGQGTTPTFTAGTPASLGVTYNFVANVGDFLLFELAIDNTSSSTIDGDNVEISTVTDNVGNIYTKLKEFSNTQTGAKTGATISLWGCVLTHAIASTDFPSVTLANSSAAALGLIIKRFTIGLGNSVRVAAGGVATLANDASDPGSMTLTPSPGSKEYLWIRATALETSSTAAWSADTNYTKFTDVGTTGGSSTSNMVLRSEWRIFTGTTQTTDPTIYAVDNASIFLALEEFSSGTNYTDTVALPTTSGFINSNLANFLSTKSLPSVSALTLANNMAMTNNVPINGVTGLVVPVGNSMSVSSILTQISGLNQSGGLSFLGVAALSVSSLLQTLSTQNALGSLILNATTAIQQSDIANLVVSVTFALANTLSRLTTANLNVSNSLSVVSSLSDSAFLSSSASIVLAGITNLLVAGGNFFNVNATLNAITSVAEIGKLDAIGSITLNGHPNVVISNILNAFCSLILNSLSTLIQIPSNSINLSSILNVSSLLLSSPVLNSIAASILGANSQIQEFSTLNMSVSRGLAAITALVSGVSNALQDGLAYISAASLGQSVSLGVHASASLTVVSGDVEAANRTLLSLAQLQASGHLTVQIIDATNNYSEAIALALAATIVAQCTLDASATAIITSNTNLQTINENFRTDKNFVVILVQKTDAAIIDVRDAVDIRIKSESEN